MPRTPTLAMLAALTLCAASRAEDAKPLPATTRIKATDPRIKLQAIAELGSLASESPEAAAALCEAIVSPMRNISLAAFEAIEKARPDLYKPISSLILDKDQAKRVKALDELVRLGGKAAPSLPILHAMFLNELKRGPDAETQGMTAMQKSCFAAIKKLGADDPGTVKLLKQVGGMDHRFSTARREALTALGDWAGSDAARRKDAFPTIKNAMSDPRCLPQCIEILGEFGAEAKDGLPALKKLKLSNDATIRALAAAAVAKIEKP